MFKKKNFNNSRDSNPVPLASKTNALPKKLLHQLSKIKKLKRKVKQAKL